MEQQFIHSIKVPNQYRKAAKLLKQTFESGQSVKGQIFEQKHVLTNRLYALVAKISKNKPKLDLLIERSLILQNEPRLDKYMCLVLMTELLFGAEKLNGQSKPVTCVLGYESKLRELLKDIDNDPTTVAKQQIDVVKPRYVRVNTNILSRADALELFVKDGWNEIVGDFTDYDKFLDVVRTLGDFDFVSDMHVKNLFVFPANSKQYWAKYASGSEKKFILQDKASCLPVTLLDPPKGSTILDMCAAPGMKTTHLAAQIRNRGKIYAVERDERRYKTLSEFVDGTKSSSVTAIQLDALLLEDDFVPNVEYILVDPSCSGSGMTNRMFVSAEKDPDRLANLTGLQSRMLSHAMRAFTRAKKIVYSTCSIHHEENEKVVQECLEMCPDWKLIKPIEFAEKWKHFGSPKFKHIGKKCIYAKSEIDLTDGFFVAIFEREIDPTKPIEPYSRNEAFLERINFNLKRKYPTDTTANIEAKKSIDEETVDLTVDADPEEIQIENVKKKKKKRKDNDLVTDDVDVEKMEEFNQENVDVTVDADFNGTQNENGKKKKKKRKDNDLVTDDVDVEKMEEFNQENVDVTVDADPEEIQIENVKEKKKKRKKNDSVPVDVDVEKIEESHQETADPEISSTKKSKKRKKNGAEVDEKIVPDEAGNQIADVKKSKKEKRKIVEDVSVSPTPIKEESVNVGSDEKPKKKKKKKHDNDSCSTETALNDKVGNTVADVSADAANIDVADADLITKKKKKSKNK